MGLQKRLHDSEILLDLAASDLQGLVQQALGELVRLGKLDDRQRQAIRNTLDERGEGELHDLGSGVGVLRVRYEAQNGDSYRCALIRVPEGVRASDHERVHYVWLIVAPYGASTPPNEDLEPFGWMLHDERFSASIIGANDPMQVLATYQLYLEYVEAPPDERESSRVPAYPSAPPPEAGLGSGLVADVRRRLPFYASDFVDGLNIKGLATILFLFFACLAPSIAFGGLLAFLTDGEIGTVEAILATAIGGVVYALFSGQPLTLLGSTGPVTIFLAVLYVLCKQVGVPFLPGLFWIGMWTAAIMMVLALTNASRYIQFFTRFTDEIFGALIALIFITEAFRDIFGNVFGAEVPTDGELLALILALGTYLIAQQLSRVRQKPLLTKTVREFLADFGPTIAIFTMTAAAWAMRPIELEHLGRSIRVRDDERTPLVGQPDGSATVVLGRLDSDSRPRRGAALLGPEHHSPPRQQPAAPPQEGGGLQPRHGRGRGARCPLRDDRVALGDRCDRSVVEPRSKLGERSAPCSG